MKKQAEKFGAIFHYENVDFVDFSGELKELKTRKRTYRAKSVILATGSEPRRLSIPGEDKFYGRGVSTCATCDAAFYKGKIVAVIGGGDSAMEEATFLTRFAEKVYLVHRREEFKASPIMVERAKSNPKIEIVFNTEVKEVVGDQTVNHIRVINNKESKEYEIAVDGVFLAIGHIPVSGYLKDKLPLDEQGYVQPLTVGAVKTSVAGVFVAGELQDHTYKQAITTSADGCKAALEAQRWLEDRGSSI